MRDLQWDEPFVHAAFRYFDGEVSDDFESQLASSPERRALFVLLAKQQAEISELLASERTRASARHRPLRPARTGFSWRMVAAAALLIAVTTAILLAGLGQKTRPESNVVRKAVPRDEPRSVTRPRSSPQVIERENPRPSTEMNEARPEETSPAPPIEAPRPDEDSPSPGKEPARSKEPPPSKPEPVPPEGRIPARPTETVVAVLAVDRVEGSAFLLGKEPKIRVAEGLVLFEGQGLETEAGNTRVTLRYVDGTELMLGPATTIRDLQAEKLLVSRGTLEATVIRQLRSRPMIFKTPTATATVLGTKLRLSIDPDPGIGTRLEVTEGRVRFGKNTGSRSVTVREGYFAVASEGGTLEARPLAKWRDRSPTGMAALVQGGTVVIRKERGLPQAERGGADLDGGIPPDASVRISGSVRLGPAAGVPYVEFTANGNLRLRFYPSGEAALESRAAAKGAFRSHGEAVPIASDQPIRFELFLDKNDTVTCIVAGRTAYRGTHEMTRDGAPLRLSLNGDEAPASGVIGTFEDLDVVTR